MLYCSTCIAQGAARQPLHRAVHPKVQHGVRLVNLQPKKQTSKINQQVPMPGGGVGENHYAVTSLWRHCINVRPEDSDSQHGPAADMLLRI